MIRSFLKSLFQPAPRMVTEYRVEPALTIADLVQADRAAGLSLRKIAEKHSLSYHMARKLSQPA